MKKCGTAAFSSVLLIIALATFTGSALAGNGNGSSEATTAGQSASHGNSASAPGQMKKAEATATTQTQTATANGSTAQNNTAAPGVKPATNTAKGTHCSTGGSAGSVTCGVTGPNASANVVGAGKSDASKRYGNNKTAAQIATTNGAPAGTDVYGPGNSQPHKVQSCAHSGHYVDVHAVKHYSSAACVTATAQTVTRNVTTHTTTHGNSTHTTVAPGQSVSATASNGGVAGVTASSNSSSVAQGGALGVTATQSSGAQGGVLGALASVGSGQLPFTGFPLWIAVAIALAMIAFGLALVRRGRATV